MTTAQRLYEGVEVGKEGLSVDNLYALGFVRVSDTALAEVRDFIGGSFGAKYLPKTDYLSRKKDAQDAHEAIRQTDVNRTPDDLEII
jgi:DNA topoisomerase-1